MCVPVKLSTCPTLTKFLGYASYLWPIAFQYFTPTLSSLLSCRNSGIPNLPLKTTKNHSFHPWVDSLILLLLIWISVFFSFYSPCKYITWKWKWMMMMLGDFFFHISPSSFLYINFISLIQKFSCIYTIILKKLIAKKNIINTWTWVHDTLWKSFIFYLLQWELFFFSREKINDDFSVNVDFIDSKIKLTLTEKSSLIFSLEKNCWFLTF